MKKTILFLATFASVLTLGGCIVPVDDGGGYRDHHGREGGDMQERHDDKRDRRDDRGDQRRGY